MKLIKFLALSVAALSMVACSGDDNTEEPGGGTGGIITQTYTRIYVDASATGWEQIGVWAWNDAESANYTGGTWPGVELTVVENIDGVDYYVWDGAPVGKEIGFIVNDFGGGSQTKDLKINVVEAGHFVVLTEAGDDGKWMATIDGEEPEVKPAPTTTLDGYTWGVLGAFNGWGSDVAMTVTDGWAVATFDNVAGSDGAFGFKVRVDGAWEHSYGIEEGAEVPTNGTEFVAAYNGKDIIVEEGNYTLSFKLNESGDGNGVFKLVKNN